LGGDLSWSHALYDVCRMDGWMDGCVSWMLYEDLGLCMDRSIVYFTFPYSLPPGRYPHRPQYFRQNTGSLFGKNKRRSVPSVFPRSASATLSRPWTGPNTLSRSPKFQPCSITEAEAASRMPSPASFHHLYPSGPSVSSVAGEDPRTSYAAALPDFAGELQEGVYWSLAQD